MCDLQCKSFCQLQLQPILTYFHIAYCLIFDLPDPPVNTLSRIRNRIADFASHEKRKASCKRGAARGNRERKKNKRKRGDYKQLEMEDDRALVDLGAAADIEEARLEVHGADNDTTKDETPALRQPKRRFVGRRAADEAAAAKGSTEEGGSGAVQGMLRLFDIDKPHFHASLVL